MKSILLAGGMLALATTTAFGSDQFAGMYGNTLHVKDADGTDSSILVNADHTWTQQTPDGKTIRGTYSWKDDTHFCAQVVDPAPKPGEQAHEDCHEITGDHKPGDSWTMNNDDGKPVTMSITAGR